MKVNTPTVLTFAALRNNARNDGSRTGTGTGRAGAPRGWHQSRSVRGQYVKHAANSAFLQCIATPVADHRISPCTEGKYWANIDVNGVSKRTDVNEEPSTSISWKQALHAWPLQQTSPAAREPLHGDSNPDLLLGAKF